MVEYVDIRVTDDLDVEWTPAKDLATVTDGDAIVQTAWLRALAATDAVSGGGSSANTVSELSSTLYNRLRNVPEVSDVSVNPTSVDDDGSVTFQIEFTVDEPYEYTRTV